MNYRDLINLLLYALLLATGQGMFKLAAETGKASASKLGNISYAIYLFKSPLFLSACLLYALSTILWVYLLGRYPLSTAYPLVIAISILMTTTIGISLFHEHLAIEKTLGLIFVVAGVFMISKSL